MLKLKQVYKRSVKREFFPPLFSDLLKQLEFVFGGISFIDSTK